MPEPQSRRGDVITDSQFTGAPSTPIFPLGVGGLNLNAALDAIPAGQFSRLTNCVWGVDEPRALTGRPGVDAFLTTAAGDLHSIARMTDLQPTTPDSVYLVGVDTALYLGDTGAAALIDSGYSGDPLTFLPHRPPLSGDPWIFVGDRDRMRKVRFDGLDVEIGLAAPTLAVTTALDTEQRTTIAAINQDAPDGTEPAAWTPNAGSTIEDDPEPTDVPVVSGATATIKNAFIINVGGSVFNSARPAAWSFFGLPITLNLNQVGAVEAADDDVIHLKVGFVFPAYMAEVRLYFVCSTPFSPSVLPGADQTTLINSDYYMKAFRPDDFAAQIQTIQSQIDASESARVAQTRNQSLETEAAQSRYPWITAREKDAETPQGRIIRQDDTFSASTDPRRNLAKRASASAGAITEFGTIGIPLRRGDFKRYGTTAGMDWGTVTGLVIYIQTTPAPRGIPIGAIVTDAYLTGGAGPDTMEPGAQSLDYRYTHYDPRTGAEGNPSPTQETTSYLDSLRRAILVNPVAYGDAAVRQRVYRRGGTNYDDWFYTGVTDSDGGQFRDTETDLGIAAAGTVEIDHYQPVATIDDAGATVLAQAVPVIFGPYNGMLLALGDPYRPGHVYGSKPDEPDHWPPDIITEVCPPSEQLMNGLMYGGQPYVFSREAGYAIYGNLTGTNGLTSAPTGCKHGLAGRWACCVGGGAMWLVSRDNIYRTAGGPEDPVANALRPLFNQQTANGYLPIDFAVERALKLAIYGDDLWFGYQDTGGNRQILIMQLQTGAWRHYAYAFQPSALYGDTGNPVGGQSMIFGGRDSGSAYYQDPLITSDDGAAIAGRWRTGSWDWGRPREEKLFMDQILDVDPQGVDLTLQNFVNSETVTNPAQTLAGFNGRRRTIWDSFGVIPQRARTLSTDVSWSTATAPPIFFVFGSAITMQPDLTVNRMTNWDDLGHPDEDYLMGVTFDCDTGGVDRTIIIERDWQGVTSTVATLVVNTDGRHKVKFSWTALQANQVRIRPNDDCLAWILYRADWIWQPEPPRIARWDIHFENQWDQYLTGLDLYCDTNSATKRIVIEMDGVALTNPATGVAFWDIVTTGRRVVHLTTQTVPPLRGHVFRFYATDVNPGLLYSHRWHLDAEPSEQHNWNQPFTILGTQADKWVKALIFEMDSFGQDKTVRVEADGVLVTTVTVNTNGRLVRQVAIPQALGRVWRFIPSDANPSRLYSIRLAFDEEPFALKRWETQELPFGNLDFKSILQHQVTLKSTAEVTLTLTLQTSQVAGTAYTTVVLTIPSTAGIKRTVFVPPPAYKWILAKFLLTSDADFWLYGAESRVTIQPWAGGAPYLMHPFGDDDADPSREMVNATLAAVRSGGTAEG